MAGKTGTAQVHNNTAAERERNFNDNSLVWEQRPNALFIAFAPADNPRYAASVVVEHELWGGLAAAPIARDLLTYALTRDPAGRDAPIGTQVSDAAAPS
jgi:penicillin-binding protein 2